MLPVALALVCEMEYRDPESALSHRMSPGELHMYQTDLNMCSHMRSLLLVQVVLLGRGRGWWAPQFSTGIQGLGLASLFTRSVVTSKLAQSHHSSQLGGVACVGDFEDPLWKKAHITSTQIP